MVDKPAEGGSLMTLVFCAKVVPVDGTIDVSAKVVNPGDTASIIGNG